MASVPPPPVDFSKPLSSGNPDEYSWGFPRVFPIDAVTRAQSPVAPDSPGSGQKREGGVCGDLPPSASLGRVGEMSTC